VYIYIYIYLFIAEPVIGYYVKCTVEISSYSNIAEEVIVTQLWIDYMLFTHDHLLTGDLVPICT
jgi:hypothetical protein